MPFVIQFLSQLEQERLGSCNKFISFHADLILKEFFVFIFYETEFVLSLAVLENSVLLMGLESSNETLKVTSVVNKHHLRAVTKNSKLGTAFLQR